MDSTMPDIELLKEFGVFNATQSGAEYVANTVMMIEEIKRLRADLAVPAGKRDGVDHFRETAQMVAAGGEDTPIPSIEFHQWDWCEGFAAFLDDGQSFNPESKAFCVLNLGSLLATIKTGDMPRDELPYVIAESMMHEIIHVLEKWAEVEFSEERVEALLEKYQASVQAKMIESPAAAIRSAVEKIG